MARKKTANLTEGELRLMNIVWAKGEATVSDVVEAIPKDNPLAYNTVLTTMRILEQKGYLERAKIGRAHVYRPQVNRLQARRNAVRHMVTSFFDNSEELLLQNIIENGKLKPEEVERLKEMIDRNEGQDDNRDI